MFLNKNDNFLVGRLHSWLCPQRRSSSAYMVSQGPSGYNVTTIPYSSVWTFVMGGLCRPFETVSSPAVCELLTRKTQKTSNPLNRDDSQATSISRRRAHQIAGHPYHPAQVPFNKRYFLCGLVGVMK